MNYIATVTFRTTDRPTTQAMEALFANIVSGHGLEVSDVHVEEDLCPRCGHVKDHEACNGRVE